MITCPVCEAQNIQLFMMGVFDSDTTRVMECVHCGMQFLDPLMTEQEEADYYEDYYRNQQSRHISTIDLTDIQQRSYEHYVKYRAIYLEIIENCDSILEIGSGTGGFIKFVLQYNPQARMVVVERSGENIEFIKNCFSERVEVLDSLDDVQGVKFDCIGAFGVFEHVRDSRGFLIKLRRHLSDNGRLALNVPNKTHVLVYGFNQAEFKKFTYMKQHYFTFTEQAFYLLAEQARLGVVKFNYMQVWGLDNHLSWLRYKEPRDFSDITSILSHQTLKSYDDDLIQRKMSDLMMAVMRIQN